MNEEIIETVNYIDVDYMTERVYKILHDAREEYRDGTCDEFLDANYSDEDLRWQVFFMVEDCNDDMKEYLHMKDHRICGNFNNVEYDYPYFRTGEVKYDHNLVNGMIKRLDDNCQDEQTQADRKWLVDWFFETFGTFGIKYNFQSDMADALYEWEHKNITA